MLILQHLWSHWTKASRGGDRQRPRLDPAYPLTGVPPHAGAWLHDVRRLEGEGFRLEARSRPLSDESWAHSEPLHPANLSWRSRGAEVEVSLHEPWASMRRTPWPAWLPEPLIVLQPGDVALVDWNGRFMNSAGGSDRGYFFAEHRFWLANAEAPARELFLEAAPRKHVDLRTRIY